MGKTFRIARAAIIAAAVAASPVLIAAPVAARLGTVEISIDDNVFEPEIVDVTAASFVEWSHDGEAQHTVTADDGSFDSGVLNPGDSFRVELGVVEEIAYHCTIHGGPDGVRMAGILLTEEDDGAPAPGAGGTPPDELPTTGFTDLPAAGLIMFALALMALGAYLTQVERLVYPERF